MPEVKSLEPIEELSLKLLDRSVCESVSSSAVLQTVLDEAERIAGSEAGAGICVLGPWGAEPTVVATAATGPVKARFPALIRTWLEPVLASKVSVSELRVPCRSESRTPSPTGSSLRVPMLEGQGTLGGFLYLESSRTHWPSERQASLLERLAVAALPAIYRAILRERTARAGAAFDVVGLSPAFLDLERKIRLIARLDHGPVLITGERGSGKELAARGIHAWSSRWERPFVPVLVSAFTEELCADELFGHERHSFTGAASEREGKFKAADGGTLLLDEVGDLNPKVQAGLLRILETGELSRIGRDLPLRLDTRVVAATNLDLHRLMEERRFRRDLYDRLRVFELRVPPLRERREDIPLLVNHFLARHCADVARKWTLVRDIECPACPLTTSLPCATPDFYRTLARYPWPGNIRELHHLVLRLLAAVPEDPLDACHLPRRFREPTLRPPDEAEDLTLDGAIRAHIQRVLARTQFNQSRAARLLGIPLSTLRSKIKKLEMELPSSADAPVRLQEP